ncbi:MAG: sporulation protein [Myxococcota bacterium]
MRRRPRVDLASSPRNPRPGETVTFRVTLTGVAGTPIDAVHLTWRSVELHSRRGERHCHFERTSSQPRFWLSRDQPRELTFEVALPPGLPPTWRSPLSRVEHEVEVHVVIPRWLDRRALFDVQVLPAPTEHPLRPALYSNAPEAKGGTELNVELALERGAVEAGGAVRGAVAVMNGEHPAVRRLEVALLVRDVPTRAERGLPTELFRSEPLVVSTAPLEGLSYPFAFALPTELPPTFTGALSSLAWHLEARAVVRLGSDVVLAPTFEVFASEREGVLDKLPPLRLAPLGSKRLALVWSRVAQRCGLSADTEATMSGRRGTVSIEVTLEPRGDRLHGVARLRWPGAGLAARVSERRWSDALTKTSPTGDARFDERFGVHGREPAQLRALLSDEVRLALLAFERVTLDDLGAELSSPGSSNTDDELEPVVRAAVTAAEALDAALASIPAPATLEPHRAAWAAEASRLGGVFCAGDCSIRGARYRDAEVELLTHFDDAGAPTATVTRLLLTEPAPEPLPEPASRLFSSIARECQGLRVTERALEATLPSPLAEPQRAESIWRALQRLAQGLRGAPTS